MTSKTMGFPSRVENNPALRLAMPNSKGFEHAEERRLFYVAHTPARSSVTLITVSRKKSAFIRELTHQHKLKATDPKITLILKK
jgi:DNA helicase-4